MVAQIHGGWNVVSARRRRAATDERVRRVLAARERPSPDALDALTPRELLTVRCLAAGLTATQAADLMGVAEGTVGKAMRRVYRVLGIEGDQHGKAAAVTFLLGLREGKQSS